METTYSPNSPAAWERVRYWKSEVERIARIADDLGRGHTADSCHQNTWDQLGPEPDDEDADGADEWFREWALMLESELTG